MAWNNATKKNLNKIKEAFYLTDSKGLDWASVNLALLKDWSFEPSQIEESLRFILLNSAMQNQVDKIKTAVKAKVPLDLIHYKGQTLLTVAAQFGALDVMRYLLEIGVNPAYCVLENMQYNALFFACVGGQYDSVQCLLQQNPAKMTVTMVEPRHQQSCLQVAAHNLHFKLAQRLITEYPVLLSHLDQRGRRVFATSLSILVTRNFDFLQKRGEEQALEAFCLFLLQHENPFQKLSPLAIPSMQVILQPSFAIFEQVNHSEQMTPFNAVRTLNLACPQLGKALMELANENPKGILEAHYLKHANRHYEEMTKYKIDLGQLRAK